MTSRKDTLAEKPWDMVGRPSSSCASVWSTLLEGCCAKKSLSEPLGNPGSAPKLCAMTYQLSSSGLFNPNYNHHGCSMMVYDTSRVSVLGCHASWVPITSNGTTPGSSSKHQQLLMAA